MHWTEESAVRWQAVSRELCLHANQRRGREGRKSTDEQNANGLRSRAHRMVAEQRWYDDFRIGERFPLPSRTMTEAILLAFPTASGDNYPIHYHAI
ncbi:hypothetical protein [Muricoccus aerilatus]|uniref:hypothetical protein n=1 Tax=Muricoccus aerilatus TaxID=452982 RepID=UPI0012EB2EA0|nr:hypothetical protein [Roseomonas aerilata]